MQGFLRSAISHDKSIVWELTVSQFSSAQCLGRVGLELIEDRAFRSLITVAALSQLRDGGAHRGELLDLAIDCSDMLKGEAFHFATGPLAIAI